MNLLLEIGTEEIPHWMIPNACKVLGGQIFGVPLEVDATPRRLVLRATGLPAATPGETQVVKGPPLSAGGKAAEGFARKQGVAVADLQRSGDYYELQKTVPGVAMRDYLANLLPLKMDIPWPKTMYWGRKGSPRFIRPIRWIVALLGDEIIPFEFAGVKSGNLSRGHRILANSNIEVNYANFETTLRKAHVILSAEERRKKIEVEAKHLGATVEPELLETLTYITEFPAAIKGDFDPAYLELPAEVLTMVMRHHQKYFAVESAPGVLAPHFVAVMNIPADPDGLVKQGNERVLKARFNDARFFWEVDQKKKLADRVADLSHVTFHARLGSYKDKTERLVQLVKELGGDDHAQRAAWLAKADLTTEMVKEFTDLQGIVGGLYAKHQSESKEVSDAIYEHYKPLSMEDSIPSTKAGQILAIADKLDNLREFFRIDMIPRGSSDQFALRRAAQGIVKILSQAKLQITVRALADIEPRVNAIYPFLYDRIQTYFREFCGFKYDEVNAVIERRIPITTLEDAEMRLRALSEVRPSGNFEPIAASLKRIRNILPPGFEPQASVNRDLLENGPERDLYDSFEGSPGIGGLLAQVNLLRSERKYLEAFEKIASLRPQIDAFFDKIMVNVPDEKIRANRLTLLHNLLTKFSTIADFSEIVTSGDQK